jgi:hypothetical protein
MDITDVQQSQLMQELIATMPPRRRPGGITASEFSAEAGVQHKTAQSRLDAFVEEGRLIKEESILDSGKNAAVFYRNPAWAGNEGKDG